MRFDEGIAVTAMSVRAPGIDDLRDMQEGIVNQSAASRWAPAGRWFEERDKSSSVRGHFVPDVYSFDERAFGVPRDQAVRLDPQQRLMLEVGRQGLESAGLLSPTASRAVGVFIGARMNSYGHSYASENRGDPSGAAPALWGRSQNFIAAWLSDRFDLSGPAMVVDTACSSSLTALWTACMAIHQGECSAALVGGVDLLVDELTIPLLHDAGALSPDGACRTFERQANGYSPGEGAGAIVLKPLNAALRDGDPVHAVVRAVQTNNDGRTMGVTTPNPSAQIELLRKAYEGIDPLRIGFIEAHGTGTLIGDPIEVQALTEAFSGHELAPGSIVLHSLKRTIGHLHSAAGIVGLIHTILHLRDGSLPSMGDLDLNPRLQSVEGPFSMLPPGLAQRTDSEWDIAGISGFGFGGTNVHAVLAKPPIVGPSKKRGKSPRVLLLSAPTNYQLCELVAQWAEALDEAPEGQACDMLDQQRSRVEMLPHRFGASGTLEQIKRRIREYLLGQERGVLRPVGSMALGRGRLRSVGWLKQARTISTKVDADVSAVENAAGVSIDELPSELLTPIALSAATLLAAEEGVPREALSIREPERPALERYAWNEGSIQLALPELLQEIRAGSLEGEGEADTLLARLEAADDPQQVVLELVVRAFLSGHDVAGKAPDERREPVVLPTWQYSGPSLCLPLLPEGRGSWERCEGSEISSGHGYGRGEKRFVKRFVPSNTPIMLHEVHHAPMLPGVGWLSFVAEALGGLRGTTVSNLTFEAPLSPSTFTDVSMSVDEEDRFLIYSKEGQRFASGELRQATEPPGSMSETLKERLSAPGRIVSGTSLYRWLRRLGYYHGRYYRNLSWILSAENGTVARVEGRRQKDVDLESNELAIGLLDSVTIAAVDPAGSAFGSDDANVVVPLSVREVRYWGPLGSASYVITFRKHVGAETQRFDQHILDEDGRVLMSLVDITSKRVPVGALRAKPLAADGVSSEEDSSSVESGALSADVDGGLLIERVASALGVGPEDYDRELLSLGLSSADLVEASARVGELVGKDLYPTVLFEYPTVAAFTEFLSDEGVRGFSFGEASARVTDHPSSEESSATAPLSSDETRESRHGSAQERGGSEERPEALAADPQRVAIIGAAVRVPGALGLSSFWSLLEQGRVTIDAPPEGPVRSGRSLGRASYLEDVDLFDPEPFRISPREAPLIDVQARIVYETILHAIDDAGGARTGNVGLWVGYGHDHYAEEKLRAGVETGQGLGLPAMVANRLSHVMDWRGPSKVVSTLCSSGLVALHEACRALEDEECDIAVVAGVQAGLSEKYFKSMNDLGALSPDGSSLPFDDKANGFVPGEGAAALVLQRSQDARSQSRRMRAVVLGSAVNHNGRTSRYSAPSARGQSAVIERALSRAGIDPRTIGMVEAHGTGTVLGDPIEIDGLSRAWQEFTVDKQFCSIGSLKGNIGHLEPAAGLAGLIKVMLAMERKLIPATVGLTRPNEHIRFADTPFFLNDRLRSWTEGTHPRRGAVSAFGLGGTNSHVIVEEPTREESSPVSMEGRSSVVRITASSEAALRTLVADADEMASGDPERLREIGSTLTACRDSHRMRLVCAGTAEEIREQMNAFVDGRSSAHRKPLADSHVTFVYPGQGSQTSGMGMQLLEELPEFRDAVARIDREGLQIGLPKLESVWALPEAELARTENAQIALVGFQSAMTMVLRSWGIEPSAVLGHSIGELVAVWASGSIEIGTLMRLVRERASSMSRAPSGGAMAAVWAGKEDLAQHLLASPGVDIAAFNSPSLSTVSGPPDALAEMQGRSGLRMHQLKVSHAFHSRDMEAAGIEFRAAAHGLLTDKAVCPPKVPCAATSRPGWHDKDTVQDSRGWGDSLSGPVDFAGAVKTVGAAGGRVFLEIGSRPTLLTAGSEILPDAIWLSLMDPRSRGPQGASVSDLHALVQNLAPYVEPRWRTIASSRDVREAPMYPFQRQSFWVGKEIT